jgi:uroporphyrinogen III methyltransferase/synthase
MTIKAKRLISQADVILFDRLLSPEMLSGLENKELIDVGKSASHHKLTQDEINALLVKMAKEGKMVVRLKGGDPYLFGRGGEEALVLLAEGIPVEVVPGVTSAIAAPELAGIPVTHRGVTSSLTIVTGHEDPGKDSPLDWSAIAKLGGTLVVLMGVSRLDKNVGALISGGKSPDTPAAIVEKGGWPEQRLVTGILGNIVQKAKDAKVEPPAILVVGEVVNLTEKLAQKDQNAQSAGKKLAILRLDAQSAESARLARESGFDPVCAPAIALEKKPLPENILSRVEASDCVVFTSANGVDIVSKNPSLLRSLKSKKIISIGPKTKIALEKLRLSSSTPAEYSSAGLEKMLSGKKGRVIFLRSAQGNQYLAEDLRKAGMEVDDVPIYEVKASGDKRLDDLIFKADEIGIFAFTSSSTARYLMERAKEMGQEEQLRRALERARVAVIGLPTAAELKRLGVRVDVMPEKFTFESMLQALRGAQ